MILFATPPYYALAEALRQLRPLHAGQWQPRRFANEELHLEITTPVQGEPCLLLASITPPDDHLLTTLLLAHTLRKEQASRVTALLPYLAYMRQDRLEAGRSQATAWVGTLLQASGIDALLTMDIHSTRAVELLPLPVQSLLPAPIFADEILAQGWQDATLIAPDEGAIPRCEAVQLAASMPNPISYFTKQRTAAGVTSTLHGSVTRRAIIVDDILDTGGTLLAGCEGLLRAGAQEIFIMVTHGLFTGQRWPRLFDLGVEHIYCTDTVPLPASVVAYPITVLSALPLLAEYL